MKRITILLPGISDKPSGGLKVTLEYANRLAADGFEVNLIYPMYFHLPKGNIRRFLGSFKMVRQLHRRGLARSWFKLHPGVKEKAVLSFHRRFLPESDVFIATSIETAMNLRHNPEAQGRTIYLIQAFEHWNWAAETVKESYRYGFRNLVIAKWLAKIIEEAGASCTLIPNGFDFDYFRLTEPVEKRDPRRIASIYSINPEKGSDDCIRALELVRETVPDIRPIFYGIPPRPKTLPDWIEYHQHPNREEHNRIYNEAAIFIAPSRMEGWGLPVGEAMICGAAVACTDAAGFLEMAEEGRNALLSPACDPQRLADNILRLIRDNDLRIRLARTAARDIRRFTWEKSYPILKSEIGKILG